MSNKDTVLLSESEIDGELLETALKRSIRDVQAGLNNCEKHLLDMIEQDEIEAESWIASHEMNVELLNLVKELIQLCKEFRPSSRALKVARESLKEKVEQVQKLNQH